MVQNLGTQDVPRLRIGIDRSDMAPEDWVLVRMKEEDLACFEEIITTAADAVESWVTEGIEESMNRFNRAPVEGQ